jgi:hypothetical protein
MRKAVWLAVAACLSPAPARADDAADARAVVDRAVRAMGGKDKLARCQAVAWKGKGSVQIDAVTVTFTDELSARGLNLYNWQLNAEVNGRAIGLAVVFNGEKGWLKPDNAPAAQEFPKPYVPLFRADLRAVRLAQHLLPLTDKAYRLSHLGELKVGDRPAVGVKVSHKDWPDVDLLFDKETSLPVRAELRLKEGTDGPEVVHSLTFDAYKEADGVKHFTKVALRRDDKLTLEAEATEVSFPEKLDDSTFEKP